MQVSRDTLDTKRRVWTEEHVKPRAPATLMLCWLARASLPAAIPAQPSPTWSLPAGIRRVQSRPASPETHARKWLNHMSRLRVEVS